MSVYRDLASSLSELMLGVPYDHSSTLPDKFRIDHLVDLARSYGMGDIDLPELQNGYRGTGFDVRQWAQEAFGEDDDE